MKTKKIEVCDAVHYNVSCEYNDPVDIKAGGPVVLGYDFYVSPDEDEVKITKFIKRCMIKYNRPFMGISISVKPNFPVDKLWTKKEISKCIKKYAV